MGSVSGGGNASRDRYSENSWQNSLENFLSNTNQQRQGNKRAVYDSPEAQRALGYLTDEATTKNPYEAQAGGAYGALTSLRGGVNPEVENIIKSTNREADTTFANRLAQSRAGGYRGGTGSSLYGQDKIASEFTNKQAGDNARLRYDAYDSGMNRAIAAQSTGAQGLAGLAGQKQGLAAQLLALLRGENVEDVSASQTAGQTTNAMTGGKSGKKSTTGGNISGTYGFGGMG